MTLLERDFPRLRHCPWERTSPATDDYNCVAWAASDRARWWDPLRYWPDGAPRERTVEAYACTFAMILGYEPCGLDVALEAHYEKVVIYAQGNEPTHMARQLPDGRWTSKCGAGQDIAHTLDGLIGDEYGHPILALRRQRTGG